MKQLYFLLFIIVVGCSDRHKIKKYSMLSEDDYVYESDTVNGQIIDYKAVEVENSSQYFHNLSKHQKHFLKHHLITADTIIRRYTPGAFQIVVI